MGRGSKSRSSCRAPTRCPVAKRIDSGRGLRARGGGRRAARGGRGLAGRPEAARARRGCALFEGERRACVASARSAATPAGENVGLAIDGAGATVVAWEEGLKSKRGDPTARTHLGVAYHPAGGRLEAPTWGTSVRCPLRHARVGAARAGRAGLGASIEAYQSGDTRPGDAYRRVYVTEPTAVRWLAPRLPVLADDRLPAPPCRSAASWSTPQAYDRAACRPVTVCVLEPAPRVAVNARGAAVAAWVDTHGRVRVAVATPSGAVRPGDHTRLRTGFTPPRRSGPTGRSRWPGRLVLAPCGSRAGRPVARASGPSAPLAARGSKRGDRLGPGGRRA